VNTTKMSKANAVARGEQPVDEEHYLYTQQRLTQKPDKVKSYKEIQKQFHQVIALDDPEKFAKYVDLLLKGEPRIIEGFFDTEWTRLSQLQKESTVETLLNLRSDKGAVLRQISSAHRIAPANADLAAKLVLHVIAGNHSPQNLASAISKEKREALRTRFLTQEFGWRNLEASDPDELRRLVFLFCSLVEDLDRFGKGSTQGVALNFSKWLASCKSKLPNDPPTSNRIDGVLEAILGRSEPPLTAELESLLQPLTIDNNTDRHSTSTEAPKSPLENNRPMSGVSEEITKDSGEALRVSHTSCGPERRDDNRASRKEKVVPTTWVSSISPEQLLERKKQAFREAEIEIGIIERLISERDSYSERSSTLRNELGNANDELDKTNEHLANLKSSHQEAEKMLAKSIEERKHAVASAEILRRELADVKASFEEASRLLEAERAEFAKSSVDRVHYELEGFRGSLRQKLKPIFENKRQTDGYEPSDELVEFLRGYISEIEEVLRRAGVSV
jgi:hypothetical protein